MIKVNLLRSTGLTAAPSTMIGGGFESSGVDEQKLAIGKAVVLLILPLALYAYEFSNLSTLKDQLATVEGEAKGLEEKKKAFGDAAPKVEKFKKQKAKIDKQMVTIRQLAKNRLQAVKALDAIQELTPPQIWYSSLTIENGEVDLKGFATSFSDFQPFFEKIQNQPVFSSFNLITQENTPVDVNGRPAYKFEVHFRIGKQDQG